MTGPPTPVRPPDGPSLFERVDRWPTALVGAAALIVAVAAAPHRAGDAAGQVWPPFVLVTGLLLVGWWRTATGSSPGPAGPSPTWRRAGGRCSSEGA